MLSWLCVTFSFRYTSEKQRERKGKRERGIERNRKKEGGLDKEKERGRHREK